MFVARDGMLRWGMMLINDIILFNAVNGGLAVTRGGC